MKKIIAIIVVVVVLIGAAMTVNNSRQNKVEGVTIGIILPLTGEYGALGENVVKGAELAKEEYMKEHPGSTITLIAEDDVLDSKKGLSAYQKLSSIDTIDALITASAPTFEVVYEDTKAKNLPVVAVNSETRDESIDNVFQIRPASNAPTKGLGEYVKKNTTGKVVAVRTNDALVIKIAKSFDEGYGSEVMNFYINRDNNDYPTIATKILAENPTHILVSAYANDGAQMVREILRQSQNKEVKPIFIFDLLFNEGFSEYEKVLADMTVLDGSIVTSIKTDLSDPYTKAYQEKYGVAPETLSELGYDAMKALLLAYDENNEDWIQNLKEMRNVPGAAGDITFDDIGLRDSKFKINMLTDGKIPAY